MADSTREAAIKALVAAIDAATDATVLRNQDVPERLPADGLVIVADGAMRNSEEMLSPLSYDIEWGARVTVVADGANADARDTALDLLLQEVVSAITDDRTLDGAVSIAFPEPAEFDGIETGGRGKAAQFECILCWTQAATPAL